MLSPTARPTAPPGGRLPPLNRSLATPKKTTTPLAIHTSPPPDVVPGVSPLNLHALLTQQSSPATPLPKMSPAPNQKSLAHTLILLNRAPTTAEQAILLDIEQTLYTAVIATPPTTTLTDDAWQTLAQCYVLLGRQVPRPYPDLLERAKTTFLCHFALRNCNESGLSIDFQNLFHVLKNDDAGFPERIQFTKNMHSRLKSSISLGDIHRATFMHKINARYNSYQTNQENGVADIHNAATALLTGSLATTGTTVSSIRKIKAKLQTASIEECAILLMYLMQLRTLPTTSADSDVPSQTWLNETAQALQARLQSSQLSEQATLFYEHLLEIHIDHTNHLAHGGRRDWIPSGDTGKASLEKIFERAEESRMNFYGNFEPNLDIREQPQLQSITILPQPSSVLNTRGQLVQAFQAQNLDLDLSLIVEQFKTNTLPPNFLNQFVPDHGLTLLKDFIYPYCVLELKEQAPPGSFLERAQPATSEDLMKVIPRRIDISEEQYQAQTIELFLNMLKCMHTPPIEGNANPFYHSVFTRVQSRMLTGWAEALVGQRPVTFAGPTGSGKTTIAAHIRHILPASILPQDRPLLLVSPSAITDAGWTHVDKRRYPNPNPHLPPNSWITIEDLKAMTTNPDGSLKPELRNPNSPLARLLSPVIWAIDEQDDEDYHIDDVQSTYHPDTLALHGYAAQARFSATDSYAKLEAREERNRERLSQLATPQAIEKKAKAAKKVQEFSERKDELQANLAAKLVQNIGLEVFRTEQPTLMEQLTPACADMNQRIDFNHARQNQTYMLIMPDAALQQANGHSDMRDIIQNIQAKIPEGQTRYFLYKDTDGSMMVRVITEDTDTAFAGGFQAFKRNRNPAIPLILFYNKDAVGGDFDQFSRGRDICAKYIIYATDRLKSLSMTQQHLGRHRGEDSEIYTIPTKIYYTPALTPKLRPFLTRQLAARAIANEGRLPSIRTPTAPTPNTDAEDMKMAFIQMGYSLSQKQELQNETMRYERKILEKKIKIIQHAVLRSTTHYYQSLENKLNELRQKIAELQPQQSIPAQKKLVIAMQRYRMLANVLAQIKTAIEQVQNEEIHKLLQTEAMTFTTNVVAKSKEIIAKVMSKIKPIIAAMPETAIEPGNNEPQVMAILSLLLPNEGSSIKDIMEELIEYNKQYSTASFADLWFAFLQTKMPPEQPLDDTLATRELAQQVLGCLRGDGMIVPWDNPAKEAAYFQPRALTSPTLVRRIFVDDMLAKPETWTFKPRTAVVTDLIQTFNTTQTLYQEQLAAIKTAIGAEGVEIPPESIVLDLDQQTKQKLIADIRWYTEKRQATLDGIATLEDQEKPVDFEEELPRMKAAYLAAERAELYPPVK